LNGLRVLELFDELHLEHFHLHNLCLLLSNHFFLFLNLPGDIGPGSSVLLCSVFFDLGSLDPLLLLKQLGLQLLLLLHLVQVVHLPLLVLGPNELGLLSFLLLMENDSIFDFLFLCLSDSFLLQHFLSCLHQLLLVDSLLLNFGLNSHFVFLFKFDNFRSTPFGFLDFFPRFHFFLFQKSDSVGEELCISLNTKS
jgi:hypothetical protein